MVQKIGEYEILFHWAHLNWVFASEADRKEFEEKEYWKGAMPAGFKVDSRGNYYLSVPRWSPGIPATVNRVTLVDGKPVLEPYPSPEMNQIGDPNALQCVLGWEIDENDRAWFLDQGHIEGRPCNEGAQKIVCWDLKSNTQVDCIPIPSEIADYTASFLNDMMVDNANGFLYIADSGIYTDPLQGGLIVVNLKTHELRRVLHQHESCQDLAGYWFEIDGEKVWLDRPMRTGADGIALSADRKTLYWCPLTGHNLYCIDTALLQDFSTPHEAIAGAVVDLGDKGTNTDGLGADNHGNIYYTMLEGQGIGKYNPAARTFQPLITDPRMIWVDGMTFDNRGWLIFNNNRLHQMFQDELNWSDPYNLIVWKAFLGEDVKSYTRGL